MILSYDIETYEFDSVNNIYKPILDARKFVLGLVKSSCGTHRKFFTNADEMFEFIIDIIEKRASYGRRTFVYGHNAEYDFYGIARKHFLNNKLKYVMFHPFLAIWGTHGYFCDSMAFYRMSLAQLGEMLGFSKSELPMEISDISELGEYLERDVDIVLKGITELKSRLSVLGFRPSKLLTAGQLSMTAFRSYCRKNYTEKYFTEYDTKRKCRVIVKTKYDKLLREAYRGGDNQALQIGKFDGVT